MIDQSWVASWGLWLSYWSELCRDGSELCCFLSMRFYTSRFCSWHPIVMMIRLLYLFCPYKSFSSRETPEHSHSHVAESSWLRRSLWARRPARESCLRSNQKVKVKLNGSRRFLAPEKALVAALVAIEAILLEGPDTDAQQGHEEHGRQGDHRRWVANAPCIGGRAGLRE